MKNTLESLYAKKFRLQAMIAEATTNGEPVSKIERLEAELATTDTLIDEENIRLYTNA